VWKRRDFSNSHQDDMMSSTFVVEPYCEEHGSIVSHHEGATLANTEPGRKRNGGICRGASSLLILSKERPLCYRSLRFLFTSFFLWTFLVVTASATDGDRPAFLAIHVEDDLAWKGSTLLIDRQPPPIIPLLMPPLHNGEELSDATYGVLSRRAAATDPNVKKNDFAVPEPFDTGLSNNFTTTCTAFLTRLRTNGDFRKCHPFSLLLQVRCSVFVADGSCADVT
jgi:hypothetical protein